MFHATFLMKGMMKMNWAKEVALKIIEERLND